MYQPEGEKRARARRIISGAGYKCGGHFAKGGGIRSDEAQDRLEITSAIHQHEGNMHPGEKKTRLKLADGGVAGGGMPMPRKDRVASNVTAVGMYRVARTRTGPSKLGRMSMNMIRHGPAPSDLAASMYSFSLIERVWPRTIREIPAHEKKVITPITIPRLGLSTAASASARTMNGKASTASMILARTVSTQPPK